MKIYTKTGDDGTTSLFSGGRVRKDHVRVEAYGTIDELNSILGVVRALQPHPTIDAWLNRIQHELFNLGADLATPPDAKSARVVRVIPEQVTWLEQSIDEMYTQLKPLKHFILPGGTLVSAQLHVARTVCRRAERVMVTLAENETLGEATQQYVNRLSDWLFAVARYANFLADVAEPIWEAYTFSK
jgi:cob(I)alamin adenosyltransferase